jgi:hypothetical protein
VSLASSAPQSINPWVDDPTNSTADIGTGFGGEQAAVCVGRGDVGLNSVAMPFNHPHSRENPTYRNPSHVGRSVSTLSWLYIPLLHAALGEPRHVERWPPPRATWLPSRAWNALVRRHRNALFRRQIQTLADIRQVFGDEWVLENGYVRAECQDVLLDANVRIATADFGDASALAKSSGFRLLNEGEDGPEIFELGRVAIDAAAARDRSLSLGEYVEVHGDYSITAVPID